MEICILAGGTGTRLREMTELLPKALIPIGNKPMIFHIMQTYAYCGHKDFILALGYKQEQFKEYFNNFSIINNDISIVVGLSKSLIYYDFIGDGWKVTLSDTGLNTLKGGRLKRIEKYVKGDTFLLTYGDGLSNININELINFHYSHGKLVTVTGVHPIPRFGEIRREGSVVQSFSEKPDDNNYLINGGYYVMNRGVFDYLCEDANCDLEIGALEKIASEGQMEVYEHKGFWRCIDTLQDLGDIQQRWDLNDAPWKVW